MKFKHLVNIVPMATIALIAGVTVYSQLNRFQAARPDYESPSPLAQSEQSGQLEPSEPPARIVVEATQVQVPQTERWQLVRVTDGDTIVVRQGIKEEKIRFCGIDAPEQEQPLGQESKAYLQQILSTQDVGIVPVERDRYGRMVAEVFVLGAEEKFVQQEMLTAGMAYVYERYVDSCWNAQPMRSAQTIAQEAHRGVWAGDYQKPWDYRHAQ
jgi:micrococcal nuclease